MRACSWHWNSGIDFVLKRGGKGSVDESGGCACQKYFSEWRQKAAFWRVPVKYVCGMFSIEMYISVSRITKHPIFIKFIVLICHDKDKWNVVDGNSRMITLPPGPHHIRYKCPTYHPGQFVITLGLRQCSQDNPGMMTMRCKVWLYQMVVVNIWWLAYLIWWNFLCYFCIRTCVACTN